MRRITDHYPTRGTHRTLGVTIFDVWQYLHHKPATQKEPGLTNPVLIFFFYVWFLCFVFVLRFVHHTPSLEDIALCLCCCQSVHPCGIYLQLFPTYQSAIQCLEHIHILFLATRHEEIVARHGNLVRNRSRID